MTTGKTRTASSYWRCQACGEVWNDARHRLAASTSNRGFDPGWRIR
jgi:ribosomal protein L37AE/L43A